jgi:leucyl-tRNA synthetase
VTVPADIDAAGAIAAAKAVDKVAAAVNGMKIVKELHVPGKRVNIVVRK